MKKSKPKIAKRKDRLPWLKATVKRETDFWKTQGATDEEISDNTLAFTAFVVQTELLKELDEQRDARDKTLAEGKKIRDQEFAALIQECFQKAANSPPRKFVKEAMKQWDLLPNWKKAPYDKPDRSTFHRHKPPPRAR